ncbi:hypothetical protein C7S15_4054 [Burkholderia cepacia]|nr:hypothetical protein [Burkholderia cepacia]
MAGRAGVRLRRAGRLRLRRCAHRVSPLSFEAGGVDATEPAFRTHRSRLSVEASDSVDRSYLSRHGQARVEGRQPLAGASAAIRP